MKNLMDNGREWYRDYHRCEMKLRRQLYKSLSKDIKEGPFSLSVKYEYILDAWVIDVFCLDTDNSYLVDLSAISEGIKAGGVITERDLLDNQITIDLPF